MRVCDDDDDDDDDESMCLRQVRRQWCGGCGSGRLGRRQWHGPPSQYFICASKVACSNFCRRCAALILIYKVWLRGSSGLHIFLGGGLKFSKKRLRPKVACLVNSVVETEYILFACVVVGTSVFPPHPTPTPLQVLWKTV